MQPSENNQLRQTGARQITRAEQAQVHQLLQVATAQLQNHRHSNNHQFMSAINNALMQVQKESQGARLASAQNTTLNTS